jgi:ABC-type branched-subunit amino acid transport system ATPase component
MRPGSHSGRGSILCTFVLTAPSVAASAHESRRIGRTMAEGHDGLLDGRPMADQVGAVALSFQAARLQLMRSRVDLDIASAAGFDPQDRRRVVLAGLLACKPRAIILHEPVAGLDAVSRHGLLTLLSDMRRDRG